MTKKEEAMEVAKELEGLDRDDIKIILATIRGYKLKASTLQKNK